MSAHGSAATNEGGKNGLATNEGGKNGLATNDGGKNGGATKDGGKNGGVGSGVTPPPPLKGSTHSPKSAFQTNPHCPH